MKIIKLNLIIAAFGLMIWTSCKDQSPTHTDHDVTNETSTPEEIAEPESKGETFVTIDPAQVDALNQKVAEGSYAGAEEIMEAYKPQEAEVEGNYDYNISQKEIDTNTLEVTLTETGIADDSVEGTKTVMTIKQENNVFEVLSIKENYRCREGRGHTEWSAELCN